MTDYNMPEGITIRGVQSRTEAWRAYVQAVTTVDPEGQEQPPPDTTLWARLRQFRDGLLQQSDGAMLRLLCTRVLPWCTRALLVVLRERGYTALADEGAGVVNELEQLERRRQRLRDAPASAAHPGDAVLD